MQLFIALTSREVKPAFRLVRSRDFAEDGAATAGDTG
jgi:hypothetical protein